MITASTAQREFLEPAMDARAFNIEQERLLFNPTPEADSLFELFMHLRESGTDVRALTSLTRRLAASNAWEGRREMAVAGAADRLVRDLRDLKLNGSGEAVLACKSIARLLRHPLQTLGEPVDDLMAFVDALRAVDEVFARAPRAQILSPTVRYELGERKYELLERLAERRAR